MGRFAEWIFRRPRIVSVNPATGLVPLTQGGIEYAATLAQIQGRLQSGAGITVTGGTIDITALDGNSGTVGAGDIDTIVIEEGRTFELILSDGSNLIHDDTTLPIRGNKTFEGQDGDIVTLIGTADGAEVLKIDPKSARQFERVTTITSSSTPTPNCDTTDIFSVTALAANATIGAPTGTPRDEQPLEIHITGVGDPLYTLTFNVLYREVGAVLPAEVNSSTFTRIRCRWNGLDGYWDVLDVRVLGTTPWTADVDAAYTSAVADAITGANIYTDTQIAAIDGFVTSITPGPGISVDNTDPANPVVSATGLQTVSVTYDFETGGDQDLLPAVPADTTRIPMSVTLRNADGDLSGVDAGLTFGWDGANLGGFGAGDVSSISTVIAIAATVSNSLFPLGVTGDILKANYGGTSQVGVTAQVDVVYFDRPV